LPAFEQTEQFLIAQSIDIILLQGSVTVYRKSPLQPEHTVYQRMLCDQRLCKLTNEMCDGKFLAMGGCGYNQTILG